MATVDARLAHLTDGRTSVVVDTSTGAPTIVHWGAPLGDADDTDDVDAVDLDATLVALQREPVRGGPDIVAPVSVVPEPGSGFPGRAGLAGRRADGTGWSPRFTTVATERNGDRVLVTGRDDVAGLELRTTVELHPTGVLRARAAVTNVGPGDYSLDALTVTLPLPAHAVDVISLHGRWCREYQPHRQTLTAGALDVENRTGRTSHEHPPLVWAGAAGFSEHSGEVWGCHLAWSGNFQLRVEVLPDARRTIAVGELLAPGEIVLAPGDRFETPWVIGTYAGAGLTGASRGFHRYARSMPTHRSSPRPVIVNTWEAVYFDHDRDRLFRLADRAAAVGAERFVLDDGWFGGRRDDHRGLGDWFVSPDAHPDGLGPLVDHVRGLGMEFGLWVEPEMVNPDSDLFRAHPDWVLHAPGYEPVEQRQQLVLDLSRPDAYEAVRSMLDTLVGDLRIDYLKWDMNRVHTHAADHTGRAIGHAQTLAVYRMIDELRAAHPDLEIESCASGGARIDLGILERAERVWTSDCIDPLERATIQRWVSTVVPPEAMGAHVASPRSHTTGRTHSFGFRAAIAFFGHFGVEWNLLELDDREFADLAAAIAAHRRHRSLLHGGDVIRIDRHDGTFVHGVIAADRSEAIVAVERLTTGPSLLPDPLLVPGLDPVRRYRVTGIPFGATDHEGGGVWPAEPMLLTGRQISGHGLQPPAQPPETAFVLHLDGR